MLRRAYHGLAPEQDFHDYNKVLNEFNMDKLKRMILGGAPYLYRGGTNYPIDLCAPL